MAGRIGFELDFSRSGGARSRRGTRSEQFRILIVGDFSGRGHGAAGPQSTSNFRTMAVDLDSFDATLARCGPVVRLAPDVTSGAEVELRFQSLDDFHPDRLYRTVDAFRLLRESRARLLDPRTFQDEAAGLLQPLLGAPAERTQRAPAPGGVVDRLVTRLVQPHIVRGADPSLSTYLTALDATASGLMRRILHEPAFQAVESLWRGVRRLVETLELGDEVTLSLLDVAKEELVARATNPDDRSQRIAAVRRLLSERAPDRPDEPPWSLLAACYVFAADPDDLTLLAELGAMAADAGVPLLATAAPSLLGRERLDERADPRGWLITEPAVADQWSDLRRSAVARWIGLALPRVLLRLPYGAATDAIESFGFEEVAGEHESFLWGHPGLACVEAIARNEPGSDDGGDATNAGLEVADLPACVEEVDGEKRLKPGAEYLLSLQAGDAMLQHGFIPLLSYRDRNAVRIARIQSIANPPAPLSGLT